MANTTTLESFVNTIRNLYQTSSGNLNYQEVFNTINTNLEVFNENSSNLLENVLPVFSLPEFTLPNMAVLFGIMSQIRQAQTTTSGLASAPVSNATNNVSSLNQEQFIQEIENCIQLADEQQVEVAADIYCELCHYYANQLTQMNKAKKGLLPLKTAIRNIQRDANNGLIRVNMLTPIHSDLLQLSLSSKNFSVALELLSHEILDIYKPSGTFFDAKYLLCFFYYTGCMQAVLKQYEQSLFYLEQALTVPATVLSQVMIEAYKKFVLISLISKGKLMPLPKYTSRIVINQIKPLCSIYHELANAFSALDLDKLNSLSEKYRETFEQDRNIGLIRQLQQSFYKKNIQKLTKTFITLSLADMAHKVKLPSAKDAEIYMLNMIKDGEIFAAINQKDGMVSFHDNPEKYDNPTLMENLTKQMFSCIELDNHIKEMDKEITTHPHYIQKCLGSSGTSGDNDNLSLSSIRQQQQSSSSSGLQI